MSANESELERPATVTVPADMSADDVRDAIKLWRAMRDPEETVAECETYGVFDA